MPDSAPATTPQVDLSALALSLRVTNARLAADRMTSGTTCDACHFVMTDAADPEQHAPGCGAVLLRALADDVERIDRDATARTVQLQQAWDEIAAVQADNAQLRDELDQVTCERDDALLRAAWSEGAGRG